MRVHQPNGDVNVQFGIANILLLAYRCQSKKKKHKTSKYTFEYHTREFSTNYRNSRENKKLQQKTTTDCVCMLLQITNSKIHSAFFRLISFWIFNSNGKPNRFHSTTYTQNIFRLKCLIRRRFDIRIRQNLFEQSLCIFFFLLSKMFDSKDFASDDFWLDCFIRTSARRQNDLMRNKEISQEKCGDIEFCLWIFFIRICSHFNIGMTEQVDVFFCFMFCLQACLVCHYTL